MPIDPSQTYVLLDAEGRATQIPGGDAFWSRPKSELDEIGRSWLVSEFECSTDWPTWEMHPHADEFIYLLSGEAVFQLQAEEGISSIRLAGAGLWSSRKVSGTPRRWRHQAAC